jgi:hypothetical protein
MELIKPFPTAYRPRRREAAVQNNQSEHWRKLRFLLFVLSNSS